MQKINCIICDKCRIVCTNNYTPITGKKRILHYCEECLKKEWFKWLDLRDKSKDEHNEKLCYCGHTHKCSCLDPGFELFRDSVINKTIKLNDPNNGWKNYTN